MSMLCKNAKPVIPLSSHAVTRNGQVGGNAWYPATLLATPSWWMARICPGFFVLSFFKSVNSLFTASLFPFCSDC